jgi:ubiquinone/menaquinone biosynthesis C-methylase UbiE
VGEAGKVLAFDIQEAAIASTREMLADTGFSARVQLIHASHGTMESHAASGSVAVVMFNLGYLPGEDHALTTQSQETLAALGAAGRVLKPGGVLSVVCYPGHPAGAVEAEAVEAWLAGKTEDGWRVARYGAIGTKRPAPFLLVARIG